MTVQQLSKVYTTTSSLMAHCIQIALQSAGIPSSIARAGNGGMDIMVPQMYCVDAQQLLIAEPHRGEILFTPGSACRILN